MSTEPPHLPTPYDCGPVDRASWSDRTPASLNFAKLWNRYAPRAKGFVPRTVGSAFRGSLQKHYIRTKYGACLAIEPSSLEVFTHMLNHGKTWNEPVLDACREYLSEGGTFYDIGANIGYLSIEMSQIFDGKISVVSFEPQPALAESIAISAKLNEFANLTVFDSMLGDRRGEAELFVGSHTIHASSVSREAGATCLKRRIDTLDEMIEGGLIQPPTVIKMDIEGGELAALKGASKTIAAYRPLIVFESDENMLRFGYERQDVLDLIASLGDYEFLFVESEGAVFTELVEEDSATGHTDILARPRKL